MKKIILKITKQKKIWTTYHKHITVVMKMK